MCLHEAGRLGLTVSVDLSSLRVLSAVHGSWVTTLRSRWTGRRRTWKGEAAGHRTAAGAWKEVVEHAVLAVRHTTAAVAESGSQPVVDGVVDLTRQIDGDRLTWDVPLAAGRSCGLLHAHGGSGYDVDILDAGPCPALRWDVPRDPGGAGPFAGKTLRHSISVSSKGAAPT